MADRYLVVAGNWNADANWSATDGGAGGASFPVAGDNAYITATSGTKQVTVNVNSACAVLDCTGSTSASPVLLAANLTVSGTFTLIGAAGARKYLYSTTRGTARTVSAGTVAFQYVDLEDITGAGAGSWDLSAITGLSGDCGGNSGITFTTPASNWLRGSGDRLFSTAANWANAVGGAAGSGRVPLPQDTAYLDATTGSGTITQDLVRVGALTCTGHTGTLTVGVASTVYGSWTLGTGQTFTLNVFKLTFSGRNASPGYTLTCSGKQMANDPTFDSATGKWTLGDAYNSGSSNRGITLVSGTLSDGGFSHTSGGLVISGTATRTLLKSGSWNLTSNGSAISPFNAQTTTGLTYTDTGSMTFTGSLTAGNSSIFLGGLAHNSITVSTTGAGYLIFRDSSPISTFTVSPGVQARFYSGQTFTIATPFLTGTAVSPVTLQAHSTTNATLAKSGGGTVTIQYATVDYLTGSPASTFYAYNSTDGGHNSQIYFATAKTATVGLDAMIAESRGATLSLDALIAEARTSTVALDALIQIARSVGVSLDALIQISRTASVSLDAIIIAAAEDTVTARSRRANVVALARRTATVVRAAAA